MLQKRRATPLRPFLAGGGGGGVVPLGAIGGLGGGSPMEAIVWGLQGGIYGDYRGARGYRGVVGSTYGMFVGSGAVGYGL